VAVDRNEADNFMRLDKRSFARALQDRTNGLLGEVTLETAPEAWPLKALRAEKLTAPRCALMAEAAHVLHPLGAQGLNLSLRDAGNLADILIDAFALGLDIGSRTVIERIVRQGADIEPRLDTVLETGDDIVIAGRTAAIVAAKPIIGPEIDADEILKAIPGNVLDVLVDNRNLHGRSIRDVADRIGGDARGVFLRALTRHGREAPLSADTRIYVGDVMTLVGSTHNIERAAKQVGQIVRSGDRTDIAFLAAGIAAGLLAGLVSFKVGGIALTLGGGGGALIAGLLCGWLRSRRPTMGAMPPAAQQTLSDLGLGGFIAAIGLANGHAAWVAIQAHGLLLVGMGLAVTLVPLIVATLFAYHVLRMNPVITCGALAGAMTVDAAVTGACEIAESQTPVLGVAVPYAVGNVVLTVLGPIIVACTFVG